MSTVFYFEMVRRMSEAVWDWVWTARLFRSFSLLGARR